MDVFLDGFFSRLLKVFTSEKEEEKSKELVFEIIIGSMHAVNNKWRDFFLGFPGFLSVFQVLKTAKSKALILDCIQFFKILLNSKVIHEILMGFLL